MRRQEQGFTLIELVIVIVILGILAAVAVPKYVDLTTDAKNAAKEGARSAVTSAIAIAAAQAKGTPTGNSVASIIPGSSCTAGVVRMPGTSGTISVTLQEASGSAAGDCTGASVVAVQTVSFT